MLAWLVLAAVALAVVVTAPLGTVPSLDGRHLLLVGAVLGVVFESEWTP